MEEEAGRVVLERGRIQSDPHKPSHSPVANQFMETLKYRHQNTNLKFVPSQPVHFRYLSADPHKRSHSPVASQFMETLKYRYQNTNMKFVPPQPVYFTYLSACRVWTRQFWALTFPIALLVIMHVSMFGPFPGNRYFCLVELVYTGVLILKVESPCSKEHKGGVSVHGT